MNRENVRRALLKFCRQCAMFEIFPPPMLHSNLLDIKTRTLFVLPPLGKSSLRLESAKWKHCTDFAALYK